MTTHSPARPVPHTFAALWKEALDAMQADRTAFSAGSFSDQERERFDDFGYINLYSRFHRLRAFRLYRCTRVIWFDAELRVGEFTPRGGGIPSDQVLKVLKYLLAMHEDLFVRLAPWNPASENYHRDWDLPSAGCCCSASIPQETS